MKHLLILLLTINIFASVDTIRILDKKTLLPIHKGLVRTQNSHDQKDVFIKAYGYKQQSVKHGVNTVLLEPFKAKALYVSFWAASSGKYMRRILELAKTTEINTVIVDVKNVYGDLSYKTNVKLAKEIGAHSRRTIKDIDAFIATLKEHNLYVIGRIAVFKDDRLARKRDELALKDVKGNVWRNKEKLAWVDPFETFVHDYVAQIAADAASHGFDEINFDYVRFPLKESLVYKKRLNQKNRVNAISDFLMTANKALRPYNVYTSVDTYGYVCWNTNDTQIGHTIESLSKHVDYIAPMLYPSGFAAGILGFQDPTDHPYEIINASINEALKKADVSSSRFRPWLQSFKDYSFDRKFFRSKELALQIKGAEHASCSGWMLWNPASKFSSKGLQDVTLPFPVLPKLKEAANQTYCFRKKQEKCIP